MEQNTPAVHSRATPILTVHGPRILEILHKNSTGYDPPPPPTHFSFRRSWWLWSWICIGALSSLSVNVVRGMPQGEDSGFPFSFLDVIWLRVLKLQASGIEALRYALQGRNPEHENRRVQI